jgi:hypothetical protein
VLPALARKYLVYALDLPGYDGSVEPPDYTPAFTARFVSAFLDAVGVERAAVVAKTPSAASSPCAQTRSVSQSASVRSS